MDRFWIAPAISLIGAGLGVIAKVFDMSPSVKLLVGGAAVVMVVIGVGILVYFAAQRKLTGIEKRIVAVGIPVLFAAGYQWQWSPAIDLWLLLIIGAGSLLVSLYTGEGRRDEGQQFPTEWIEFYDSRTEKDHSPFRGPLAKELGHCSKAWFAAIAGAQISDSSDALEKLTRIIINDPDSDQIKRIGLIQPRGRSFLC